VIHLAKGKISIQNINLENIMRDIKLTFQYVEWFSFQHILRELNLKADELSKEALQLQTRDFEYYKSFGDTET
jgi:hypothetical protein